MLQTKHIYLRLVEETDAAFILSLRMNESLNKYLSPVSPAIEEQKEWIQQYKIREKVGRDYYFIIVDIDHNAIGMVRIYDINYNDGSFTWGSWILAEKLLYKYAALESMLLSYDFAFNELSLNLCKFKVYTDNLKAKHFYERFGSTQVFQDESETYFELSKRSFIQLKYSKYYKFLLI